MSTYIRITDSNPVEDNLQFFREYSPYIDQLPKTEQNLIAYREQKRTQQEIAKIIGITQGAVSSKIAKIKKRLKFLKFINQYDWSPFNKDLSFIRPFDLELIKIMIKTTCQSETARQLNDMYALQGGRRMNQVKVRHRYGKCLIRVAEEAKKKPGLVKFLDLMNLIKHNLYMLHEVRLAHFDHRSYLNGTK